MNVLRKVPDVPAARLSVFEKFHLWLSMNRTVIGTIVLAISTVVRIFMAFQGHTEVADVLKTIADLFMGTGLATLAAGATKSDAYHEEQAVAEIRMRSGEYPVYRRRHSDSDGRGGKVGVQVGTRRLP